MNNNQLKLNLINMKTLTNSKNKTIIKYYNFLINLKYEIENEQEICLTKFCKKHTVSTNITTFLYKNNIIFKDELRNYTWNEKIPVSNNLAKKFIEYRYEINKNYQLKITKENKINTKKSIKVEPKLIVKDYKNMQEVGLIRKFLKWIY